MARAEQKHFGRWGAWALAGGLANDDGMRQQARLVAAKAGRIEKQRNELVWRENGHQQD